MKNYIILSCDMLNDDNRKYGTVYFIAEDPKGHRTERDVDEIRALDSNDIWNQTWIVMCSDRDEASSKKFEYLQGTGQL